MVSYHSCCELTFPWRMRCRKLKKRNSRTGTRTLWMLSCPRILSAFDAFLKKETPKIKLLVRIENWSFFTEWKTKGKWKKQKGKRRDSIYPNGWAHTPAFHTPAWKKKELLIWKLLLESYACLPTRPTVCSILLTSYILSLFVTL